MSRSSGTAIDAVVVGGGPAGLNAALMLGRARRNVVLFDAGEPRNKASHAMHGFLSRDGFDPAHLRAIAREQLGTYSTVVVVTERVDTVERGDGGFEVVSASGGIVTSRKLLFAVGISDALPAIEGLASMYGISVFHCPYCDAWERRDQPLAVICEGSGGFRLAMLLTSWSRDVVLCTCGPSGLESEQMALLDRNGVVIREGPISRLVGDKGRLESIAFEDGTSLERRAAFFHGPVVMASDLPQKMGCALSEAGWIEVDEGGRTSVEGVYAAGDAARRRGQHPATQVIIAAAAGAVAGICLHQDLVHEDVGLTPALPRAAVVGA